ncbi:MAG: rhodanese-like domain-containing protein [Eubacteriales bacterium]|nr:rhodanese-like domain-containing protein [Eubacteriales bacterium]
MGFLDFLKHPDINRGIETYQATGGAVLLDVRTPQEYSEGHIPGSRNIPLQTIDQITSLLPKKDTPLYVYCYSGARSAQAVGSMGRLGYTNVTNLGGIADYTGKVER